jgi:hypothetical protein
VILGTLRHSLVSNPLDSRTAQRPMKRALGIVAAVTGYAFVETLLLLSIVLPRPENPPGIYQSVVLLAQVALLPGIAALFSRIIYGPRKWGRRTLVMFLLTPLALCVFIFPFFVIAVLFDWTFIVSRILFAVAMAAVFGAMLMGLRWCLRRLRTWSAESEVERWLAERDKGSATYERKWRNKSVRVAVCIPATTVLLVFLFLPEAWGLLSHLSHSRSGKLPGYEIAIPATWVVLYQQGDQSDGSSRVSGLAGKGIGTLVNPMRSDELSGWEVGTLPFNANDQTSHYPSISEEKNVISRRILRIDDDTVTCVEYLSALDYASMTFAHVTCEGSSRLFATFDGPRTEVPTFFRMLDSTRRVR